jgi:hypothetical protein
MVLVGEQFGAPGPTVPVSQNHLQPQTDDACTELGREGGKVHRIAKREPPDLKTYTFYDGVYTPLRCREIVSSYHKPLVEIAAKNL